MTEHEDHEAKADDVERSLDEMQQRSERLEGEIETTGEDWERKQRDPGVPGAVGDSDEEGDGEGTATDGEDLDFGRAVDYEAAVEAPRAQNDDDEEESGDSPDDDR